MRVLHVVPSYVPAFRYGGPIWSVHGLCKALVRAGHDVHVFTTDRDGPRQLDVELEKPVDVDGVKVWYFPVRHLRRLFWAPAMKKALRRDVGGFDLVHLHSVYLWPTAIAARVARRAQVPYIIAPRGMLVGDLIERRNRWLKKAWIAWVERANVASAAALHFTSGLESDEARRLGLTFGSSFVLPNGVDVEQIEAGDSLDEERDTDSPFLLYIGRINWKKGLDRLLEAVSLLPGCRLVIAGNDEEGYQPRLSALAERLGVSGRVTFAGPVYGCAKRGLLRSASALVLASYSENFGNVVIEAMAAGCPVIVTREVGAAALVEESGAGIVLDGDCASLSQGIGRMLADRAGREQMGRSGRNAAALRYSWDAVAARMEAVYDDLLARRCGVAAGAARASC